MAQTGRSFPPAAELRTRLQTDPTRSGEFALFNQSIPETLIASVAGSFNLLSLFEEKNKTMCGLTARVSMMTRRAYEDYLRQIACTTARSSDSPRLVEGGNRRGVGSCAGSEIFETFESFVAPSGSIPSFETIVEEPIGGNVEPERERRSWSRHDEVDISQLLDPGEVRLNEARMNGSGDLLCPFAPWSSSDDSLLKTMGCSQIGSIPRTHADPLLRRCSQVGHSCAVIRMEGRIGRSSEDFGVAEEQRQVKTQGYAVITMKLMTGVLPSTAEKCHH